jgi:hypothetical protein
MEEESAAQPGAKERVMGKMSVNRAGLAKARRLIKNHQYVLDSDWSEANPTATRQNSYLKEHDWAEYGRWFLAIDREASEETKDRFNFPFGDFRRLHRAGLIAAKQRAAQNGYRTIENAADRLLTLLDEGRAD